MEFWGLRLFLACPPTSGDDDAEDRDAIGLDSLFLSSTEVLTTNLHFGHGTSPSDPPIMAAGHTRSGSIKAMQETLFPDLHTPLHDHFCVLL